MLPRKIVGTAVIFLNEKGALLIVKPDYRDGWLVPGGSVDENESPLHCAIRETKEEIGLADIEMTLCGIYYAHAHDTHTDALKFIYYGGMLTEERILRIKLQTEELEQYTFVPPEEAIRLFSTSLQKSIPKCLDAIKNKTVAYIES